MPPAAERPARIFTLLDGSCETSTSQVSRVLRAFSIGSSFTRISRRMNWRSPGTLIHSSATTRPACRTTSAISTMSW